MDALDPESLRFNTFACRGEWLPYERFRLWLDARGMRRKAGEMKTHASRMKKVREMVARLREAVMARAS